MRPSHAARLEPGPERRGPGLRRGAEPRAAARRSAHGPRPDGAFVGADRRRRRQRRRHAGCPGAAGGRRAPAAAAAAAGAERADGGPRRGVSRGARRARRDARCRPPVSPGGAAGAARRARHRRPRLRHPRAPPRPDGTASCLGALEPRPPRRGRAPGSRPRLSPACLPRRGTASGRGDDAALRRGAPLAAGALRARRAARRAAAGGAPAAPCRGLQVHDRRSGGAGGARALARARSCDSSLARPQGRDRARGIGARARPVHLPPRRLAASRARRGP